MKHRSRRRSTIVFGLWDLEFLQLLLKRKIAYFFINYTFRSWYTNKIQIKQSRLLVDERILTSFICLLFDILFFYFDNQLAQGHDLSGMSLYIINSCRKFLLCDWTVMFERKKKKLRCISWLRQSSEGWWHDI